MRLSELLEAHVVDGEGQAVGKVVDVRLIQDGPVMEGFGAALRVKGFVVGRRGLGTRLGFHRGGLRGPGLLRVLLASARRSYFAWSQVSEWDVEASLIRLAGSPDPSPVPDD